MGADLAAEEQFGPYLVYERLGVGGMATVHRALERGIEGFERIVALKRLLPHLAEDASFIKSFVREAKLASILNHNNIVQIFELGRVGTEYFISMEYIDGRDIRQILRHARKVTGPPPIHVTVGLLLQLCDALDYAHGKVDDQGLPLGLVHRDVSPSNLLVTSAGHLKVIDFGIAKAQSSQLRTQTGRVKGKLAYMAPEAITGKELDARSDIFAAGVIAHELLTARPLFASKNEYQTLLKVQRGDIMPPSTFNHAVPPQLDAIVLAALERDPDERTPDAATLREGLLGLRKNHQLQTSHRDVAQWLEWAFSLEAPTSAFGAQNTFDQSSSHSVVARKTPAKREEDEAVEMAWGGGEPQNEAPVVLDDVPDVSDKHLGAAPRIDLADDLADDIPAHQPTHGAARTVRDTAPQPTVRDTQPSPAVDERPASRSTPPPIPARRSSGAIATPDPDSLPKPARALSDLDAPEPPSLVSTKPGITARPARPREVTIGAAIVARESTKGSKTWVIIASILALGAAATAVTLYLTRGQDTVATVSDPVSPAPQPKQLGTIKFDIEPADAEITVQGQTHQGGQWSTQLPPGVHSIQIAREGYKARLASIELSAGETTTMIVSLEKLGASQTVADANLIMKSDPPGLDLIVDGKFVGRTPQTLPISVGPHVLALRQNGVEVWRQQLNAQASFDHEFSPSMSEVKQRERRARAAQPPPQEEPRVQLPPPPPPEPKTVVEDKPPPQPEPPKQEPKPEPPKPEPPKPEPPKPAIVQQPKPVVIPQTGPITVAPTAVTRISGETPTVGMSRRAEVPAVIAAKVCINPQGAVTGVDILSKLERHTSLDLTATIRGWRYAPYKQAGVAVAACFVVSFRVK